MATQKFINNFHTTLAATLGETDTSVQLLSTEGLPALSGGDYILLTLFRKDGVEESGHEVIKVTAWSGVFLTTVERAVEGAAASQFLAGDHIASRVTAKTLTDKGDKAVLDAVVAKTTNIDNTSDANKPVSTAQAAADTTILNTAKAYAESLVVGLWDDRGNHDASSNAWPSSGGSGASGAILKGDIWTISIGGTLGGVPVAAKQTIRALVDAPGTTASNWAIATANTDIEDTIADGVTARAPSQNAVFDALSVKEPTIAAGTTAQYWRGDKTWRDLAGDVRNTVLTGLSLASAAAVTATDTILVAVGKLQKQVTDNLSTLTTFMARTDNPHNVTKAQVGLSNADNTSDVNKPVSTAQAAADAATLASAQSYADGLVVGLWDDRGSYNASVNTWPASGGSGASGAILKGDIWMISTAGTLGGTPVAARQTIRALVDAPGQTATNWAIGLANTDIDDSITSGVTGRAPSQAAVFTALAGKANTGANSSITSLTGTQNIELNSTVPYLYFNETDQSGAVGKWRMVGDSGAWRMDMNTATARDFSTYVTPLGVDSAGKVSTNGLTVTANATLIQGGTAENLSNNGFLQIGGSAGLNVVFDYSNIQARSNGSAAALSLNASGGVVAIGQGGLNVNSSNGIYTTGPLFTDGVPYFRANQDAKISLYRGGSTNEGWIGSTASYCFVAINAGNTAYRFSVDNSGNATAWGNVTAYSDEHLKKNWRPVREDFVTAWADVKHGIYDRIDMELTQVGASAQSVQRVLPEAVSEGDEDKLTLNYGGAALVATIKLAQEVVSLRDRIAQQDILIQRLLEKAGGV